MLLAEIVGQVLALTSQYYPPLTSQYYPQPVEAFGSMKSERFLKTKKLL